MNKKLHRDGLLAELASVKQLLERTTDAEPATRLTLNAKREDLEELLDSIEREPDTLASVALYFGGSPVTGSRSIESQFAARALEQYQDVVSKKLAVHETGGLQERGPVPSSSASRLDITNIVHGSFGFLLEEHAPDGAPFLKSSLRETVESVTNILDGFSNENEESYNQIIDEIDERLFTSIGKLIKNIHLAHATFRLVEGDRDRAYTFDAVERAFIRIERTDIVEDEYTIQGSLVGIVPYGRKFELRDLTSGEIVSGSIGPSLSRDFLERIEQDEALLGQDWSARLQKKTTRRPNGSSRTVFTLLDLAKVGELPNPD
tara:strand:- start:2523 stop:3479 length:957 start_codon:yes stop_codon:yes gene_type:complete